MELQRSIKLSQYTTLKVGGVADYFVRVSSEAELIQALKLASEISAGPPLILGGGSNVLISDDGYQGMVIVVDIKGISFESVDDTTVLLTACAGESLDEVVADSVCKKLWGLENLSAIPGTIGATPIQNVGAYGVEVSSLIKKVFAINIFSQEEKVFSNDDCQFSYRNSFFKTSLGRQWAITKVVFALTKNYQPQLNYADLKFLQEVGNVAPQTVREAVIKIRSNKFPDWREVGTAGSFFKNPIINKAIFNELKQRYPALPGYEEADGRVKISLGFVLDKILGLRGYCEGSVCLYDKQALVLVNTGGATATDIKNFSEKIIEKVFLETKIKIEREVLCF